MPQTKCTKHFESALQRDLSDWKILKLLSEKGGSRKSGRTQKEIILECVANSKHALSLWRKMHYNAQFYILCNLVFAYHDALDINPKQTNMATKEQQELYRLIIKGIDEERPFTACEMKELNILIKAYSNKIEHATGFAHNFMLKPELNDWVNYDSLGQQLNTHTRGINLVQELKSHRQRTKLLKPSHDDYEQRINEYRQKIERIHEYIKNIEEEDENYVIMREHQNIREYEKEIDVLRHNLHEHKLTLMNIEIKLFKSTLAPIFGSLIENEQDKNEHDDHSPIFIPPWLYNLDLKVTR